MQYLAVRTDMDMNMRHPFLASLTLGAQIVANWTRSFAEQLVIVYDSMGLEQSEPEEEQAD